MSYIEKGLRRINYGGAISSGAGSTKSVWHYATNDTQAEVEASGYFNAAYAFLAKGDIIQASLDVDGTPVAKNYIVTSATGATTVTIRGAEGGVGAGVSGSSMLLQKGGISSAAGDAEVARFVAPFKGTIQSMRTVLNDALATGDATVTLAINGTPVTGGVATITQASSAAGDVDTATPSAANAFDAGDVITATVGGSSDATGTLDLNIVIEETV